jgi:glycerol-3-phosphate dehydrogenase
MQRNVNDLVDRKFDVLVVGGGVLGAFAAWDAALRGLRVALIDRGDFGGATTANSMGIIHGGLRYLQQLNLPRARRSLSERATWLRIAPHLTRPLPVLVPTASRALVAGFRTAVALVSALERDLVSDLPASQRLPRSTVLSPRECAQLVPEIGGRATAVALMFHDAQLTRPERAIVELVSAAVSAGAIAANYVELRGSWTDAGGWRGVRAWDVIDDVEVPIRARFVLNTTGPAAGHVADLLLGRPWAHRLEYSWSLNLAFDRPPPAVAYTLDGGVRRLFVVPWRGLTVIGTAHYEDRAWDRAEASDADIGRFLDEVNSVWIGRLFAAGEVRATQAGLIALTRRVGDRLHFREAPLIVDHRAHGVPQLVTAVTEKLTTARYAAEKAVNLVCARLRHRARCMTASTLLPGAEPSAVRAVGELEVSEDSVARLRETYGSRWRRPLEYARTWNGTGLASSPEESALVGQLALGAVEEMAQNPDDLLHRRLDLGPRGVADPTTYVLAKRVLEEARRRLAAGVGTA